MLFFIVASYISSLKLSGG